MSSKLCKAASEAYGQFKLFFHSSIALEWTTTVLLLIIIPCEFVTGTDAVDENLKVTFQFDYYSYELIELRNS